MTKDLLVMIPAYNEGEAIRSVLEDLLEIGLESFADILVIDDGSSDNTKQVVESTGVKLLTGLVNMGYGSAVQMGYKYARKHSYQYVIQLDADGQHDVSNVLRIYKCLTGKNQCSDTQPDIVIGSRFLSDQSTFKASGMKLLAIKFFRFFIWLFTRQKITDPTSGLQGLNRRTFSYYASYNNFDYKYPDINMIMQMLFLGFKVIEVPAIMHERTSGVSMHSGIFKQISYMVIIMLSTIGVIIRNRKA